MWVINILLNILVSAAVLSVPAEAQINIYLTGKSTIIEDCPSGSSSDASSEVSCPESEGFFKASNNQCFRFFEGGLQWEAAKEKCESEGMVMAKPEDDIIEELQEGVKQISCPSGYNCKDVWLGGRGSAEGVPEGRMVWDRDGTEISNNSPLWAKYEPFDDLKKSYYSDKYCLTLGIGYVSDDGPYRANVCQHNFSHKHPLCEVISA